MNSYYAKYAPLLDNGYLVPLNSSINQAKEDLKDPTCFVLKNNFINPKCMIRIYKNGKVLHHLVFLPNKTS